jgi:hypothetical protein
MELMELLWQEKYKGNSYGVILTLLNCWINGR